MATISARSVRFTLLAIVIALVAPAAVFEAPEALARAGVGSDFDGDGHADLAIGVPGEEIDGNPGSGRVSVLYGTPDGLSADSDQSIDQRAFDGHSPGAAMFGSAVEPGDFDGDGYADLAIGAPGHDGCCYLDDSSELTFEDSGALHVAYGARGGLGFRKHEDTWFGGMVRDGVHIYRPEAFDQIGSSLAAGDFDADGYADLAVGIPGEGRDGGGRRGLLWFVRGTLLLVRSALASRRERRRAGPGPCDPHLRVRRPRR